MRPTQFLNGPRQIAIPCGGAQAVPLNDLSPGWRYNERAMGRIASLSFLIFLGRGARQVRRSKARKANQDRSVRPPFSRALETALRLRCPNCREGVLFGNWLNKILPHCPHCGLSYHPESGYYLGGMIVTYLLTAGVLIPVYLLTLVLPDVTFFSRHATLFWVGLAILLTFGFVRPAYSLWLALDYWVDPWRPGSPRS